MQVRVRCVGAVIRDDSDRLLLIRRRYAPAAGCWSIPGGRVEPGESDAEAVAREVEEETGLRIEVSSLIGTVERPGPGGAVYDIFDYAATPVGGSLTAGSDAVEARWVDELALRGLHCSPGLVETLQAWGVVGASSSSA